jgi:hypothetical protein
MKLERTLATRQETDAGMRGQPFHRTYHHEDN